MQDMAVSVIGVDIREQQAFAVSGTLASMACGLPYAIAAGIAGVFTAAQVAQAPLTQFDGLNIDVIAAVLVGGTALQGGEGSTLRSALGAVFIALLANLMLLRNAQYGTRLLVTGLVVVVATSAFHLLRTRGRR